MKELHELCVGNARRENEQAWKYGHAQAMTTETIDTKSRNEQSLTQNMRAETTTDSKLVLSDVPKRRCTMTHSAVRLNTTTNPRACCRNVTFGICRESVQAQKGAGPLTGQHLNPNQLRQSG